MLECPNLNGDDNIALCQNFSVFEDAIIKPSSQELSNLWMFNLIHNRKIKKDGKQKEKKTEQNSDGDSINNNDNQGNKFT